MKLFKFPGEISLYNIIIVAHTQNMFPRDVKLLSFRHQTWNFSQSLASETRMR